MLLHELGHVIDTDRNIVPDNFSHGDITPGCGYACLSWQKPERHRYRGQLSRAMAYLDRGAYGQYIKDIPKTLDALRESNFPSLYATLLPEEDFADSFAMYVHTVMLATPGSSPCAWMERSCRRSAPASPKAAARRNANTSTH